MAGAKGLSLILGKNVALHLSKCRWSKFACVWIMVLVLEALQRLGLLPVFMGVQKLDNKAEHFSQPPGNGVWQSLGQGISEGISILLGVFCPLSTILRLFGIVIFDEKENNLMEVQKQI